MKILVCIKQVPESNKVEVDPVTGVLKRDGAASKMNPYDLYALETAFRIREEVSGSVHVISMGPPQAQQVIREAFAMGADGGTLLSDRKFGGADVLATSYTLAQGIKSCGDFDLILCGKQTTDGDTAQVGPQVAEDLDIPQVTYAWEVWPTEDGKSVRVKKELEEGFEILEMACPCAVTVTKPDYEPRFPTIKSKMAANKAKIPVLSAADCGLDVERSGLKGSPTKVKKSFTPPRKEGGLKIKEETPEESAKKLYDLLKDKGII